MIKRFTWKTRLLLGLCLLLLMTGAVWIVSKTHERRTFSALRTAPLPTLAKNHPNWKWVTQFIPWESITVAPGDSPERLFKRLNLSHTTLRTLLDMPLVKQTLQKMQPGQQFYIQRDAQKKLLQLKYAYSPEETLWINNTNHQFTARTLHKPVESTLLFKSGTVKTTLSEAAHKAGLTPSLLKQLEYIFAGNINYRRDIRPGDQFRILYREYFIDGKKYHPGNIIAAEFTNRHKTYRAVRFQSGHKTGAYFTPKGTGITPLFLRKPLAYKRISDHYKLMRKDPYDHQWRPHLGIDYAATAGTPVKSIGRGRVVYKGKKGGYGNAVVIAYGRKYRALYGHLKRFARPLHVGQAVKRGQTIGYVGSTGWSTGPHLHLSFYVYGIPRNFLAMKLPSGRNISKKERGAFKLRTQSLLNQLETFEQDHA